MSSVPYDSIVTDLRESIAIATEERDAAQEKLDKLIRALESLNGGSAREVPAKVQRVKRAEPTTPVAEVKAKPVKPKAEKKQPGEGMGAKKGQQFLEYMRNGHEIITRAELANAFSCTPVAAHHGVHWMVRNGLVTEKPDPDNKRKKFIYLNEAKGLIDPAAFEDDNE